MLTLEECYYAGQDGITKAEAAAHAALEIDGLSRSDKRAIRKILRCLVRCHEDINEIGQEAGGEVQPNFGGK
jgi:hypothetical protein